MGTVRGGAISGGTIGGRPGGSRRRDGRFGGAAVLAGLAVAASWTLAGPGAGGGAWAGTPTVQVTANARYGDILTDGAGVALYTLDTDHDGLSTCHGACAQAWPPLTVPHGTDPTGGPGMPGTVGVARQTNGTDQVTYNGMPLYTFVGDTAPGQVTGDGVAGFSVVVTGAVTSPTTTTTVTAPTAPAPSAAPTTGTKTSPAGSPAAPAASPVASPAAPGTLAFTGPAPWLGWLLVAGLLLMMFGLASLVSTRRAARRRIRN
jgi:predicted lipoprotein with Yx(FWY)xxD motif